MINGYFELTLLLALINVIFALSLNLILGYNGQFSLGHAGFLAIGAYASGVATASFGLPLWLGLLLAVALSILSAALIGWPCLRLRGDYLAIATLGFAEIVRIVLQSLPPKTFGGPTGMATVHPLRDFITTPAGLNGLMNAVVTALVALALICILLWALYCAIRFGEAQFSARWRLPLWRWLLTGLALLLIGLNFKRLLAAFSANFMFGESFGEAALASNQWAVVLVFLALVGAVIWLIVNYLNSQPGRMAIAIREDEIAAMNLGIDITWMKLQNFMLGAALAGLAGALTAHTLPLFKPTDFDFFRSVDVLLMVVLGGLGSITGSIIGALSITSLLELLRFLGQWRLVIYSLLLVLMMLFRPGGLMGTAELGAALRLRWLGGKRGAGAGHA